MAIYFNDNFNSYADNTLLSAVNSAFTIVSGTNDLANGMFVQSGRVVSAFSKAPIYRFLLPGHPTDSYAVEFDLYINLTGAVSACWPRMATSSTEGYRLLYSAGNLRLQRITSGFSVTNLGTGVTLADTVGTTYKIRAEVDGGDFRVYVDDVLRENISDSTYTTGVIALHANSKKAQFDRLLLEDLGGGTPPSGTVTIGTITPSTTSASVPYSYSAADQTGFEYRLNGGTAASIGTSPATISGLTANTPYTVEVRAINTSGAGAWSAAANFTTSAASDTEAPSLTGSVTFASITQTTYTAQWPAGSDNVAVTGYEYQIGGTAGAWTDAGNNLSAAITGRTAGTTETVYVRAYDAAGLRSTPAISGEVTLLSASTDGTITVGSALYPIKYSSASVLNESGIRATVLDATTLAEVLNTSGVVCNAGVITITDAALVIGSTYHLAVKTASGWTGFSDAVTAS